MTTADRLVAWLEDGRRRDDLFADDVLVDFTVPLWRIQGVGAEQAFAIREQGHPHPGSVRIERSSPTPDGYVLQIEERWNDGAQDWYCREVITAVERGDRIAEIAVHCTGDWDEALQRRHAAEVELVRP